MRMVILCELLKPVCPKADNSLGLVDLLAFYVTFQKFPIGIR